MPFHGEASKQAVKVTRLAEFRSRCAPSSFETRCRSAQETLTRTIEMVDGENVVYVTSDLQSGLAADRPISWAEHATLGPPFLERGKTVVDMPALNCRVRPFKPGGIPGRLAYDRDFQWPMAPTKDNGQADLRLVPVDKTIWTWRVARWTQSASWHSSPRSTWTSICCSAMSSASRIIRG